MQSENSSSAEIFISQGTIVCRKGLKAVGHIMIGSRTIIHPNVSLIAEAGPIIIGSDNVIEERCVIANRFSPDAPVENQSMVIGDENLFEVASECRALQIGDRNVIGTKAHIGRAVQLSSGCFINPHCSLMNREILPENTVVFSNDGRKRIVLSHRTSPTRHIIELLTEKLPTENPILPDFVNKL